YERVEGLFRDEHDAGRRDAEAVGVDLEDLELGEWEGPEEALVELDDQKGQIRELLRGPLVLARVRGHADRETVARLLLLLVLAREHDRELHGLVDLGLDDRLVALGLAGDRPAGRERDEGLLDPD